MVTIGDLGAVTSPDLKLLGRVLESQALVEIRRSTRWEPADIYLNLPLLQALDLLPG